MSTDARQTVMVSVTIWLGGFEWHLSLEAPLDMLPKLVNRLTQIGASPIYAPINIPTNGDGVPVCPKHWVAMSKHTKQGDTWHSHATYDAHGKKSYCRGYAGPDSPGWDGIVRRESS